MSKDKENKINVKEVREPNGKLNIAEENKYQGLLDKFDGDPVAFLMDKISGGEKQEVQQQAQPQTQRVPIRSSQEFKNPSMIDDSKYATSLDNNYRQPQTFQAETPTTQPPQQQYTQVEIEALKNGWLPLNEFKGDPAQWTNAGQYLKNGRFGEKIKNQEEILNNLLKRTNELYTIMQKQERYLAEEQAQKLKKKIEKAMDDRQIEEVVKYQNEYNSLMNGEVVDYAKNTPTNPDTYLDNKVLNQNHIPYDNRQIHPELLAFQQRNQWFNDFNNPKNAAITAYAKEVDKILEQKHPDWAIKKRLEQVEDMVKQEFSEFYNFARDGDIQVETPYHPPQTDNTRITYNSLNEDDRAVIDMVVDSCKGDQFTTEKVFQRMIDKGIFKEDK
jgi:hypothetical protein